MNKRAFTLIELLVVVLIIGILAAIALPQYQLAVGKSRYAALKNTTKTLKGATERYYLLYNSLPTKFDDLDISFSVKEETVYDKYFTLRFDDMQCDIYNNSFLVYCHKRIMGKDMYYWSNALKTTCYAGTAITTDVTNKICQQDTGKTSSDCQIGGNMCIYSY